MSHERIRIQKSKDGSKTYASESNKSSGTYTEYQSEGESEYSEQYRGNPQTFGELLWRLQRTRGNSYVGWLLQSGKLQRKCAGCDKSLDGYQLLNQPLHREPYCNSCQKEIISKSFNTNTFNTVQLKESKERVTGPSPDITLIRRKTPEQKSSFGKNYKLDSDMGATVKLGSTITYSILPILKDNDEESPTSIQWSFQNDPFTFEKYKISNPDLKLNGFFSSKGVVCSARAIFPGTHKIIAKIIYKNNSTEKLIYKQIVTEDGRSLLHKELIKIAEKAKIDKPVVEWTTWDIIKWKFPKLGDPNYVHDFKKQWVHGYRKVIREAAGMFDIPEVLLGGVAYIEVGGDPLWIDDIAYSIRNFDHLADPVLEPLTITKKPELTSFGNISMQIRRAAETLGYDPKKLSGEQKEMIVESLKDPKQNIFIAAKHLSELRDIDYKGKKASMMTKENIMVTGTRYNRGPELSLNKIKENLSYGKYILKKYKQLLAMLND